VERERFGFYPGLRTPRLPTTHARAETAHWTLDRITSSSKRPPIDVITHDVRHHVARLLPASIRPLRRPNGEVLSPPLGHKAPRGARFPRSPHTRYDRVRVPSLRRGQRCSHDRLALPGRRLPLLRGQALHPGLASISRGNRDDASTRVHVCSPIRRFPSPAVPGWCGNRLGFSPELRTPPPRGRRRTPGWGQALSTCPGLHLRHQPNLQPVNPLALSGIVSHMQIHPHHLRAVVGCLKGPPSS
jgi:hypothetical protein